MSILERMDRITGDRLAENGSLHRDDLLQNYVINEMKKHYIGVLIVENMEHLDFRTKETYAIMSFLDELITMHGISVVYVGNDKTRFLLGTFGSLSMSAASGNDVLFEAMTKNDSWNHFTECLFQMQWLKNPAIRTNELTDILYKYSKEIASIAARAMIEVQVLSLQKNQETFTAKDLEYAAEYALRTISKEIGTLRADNPQNVEAEMDTIHL